MACHRRSTPAQRTRCVKWLAIMDSLRVCRRPKRPNALPKGDRRSPLTVNGSYGECFPPVTAPVFGCQLSSLAEQLLVHVDGCSFAPRPQLPEVRRSAEATARPCFVIHHGGAVHPRQYLQFSRTIQQILLYTT